MFKSYVISLKLSPRRESIIRTFAAAGLPFEFVDADDPECVKALSIESREHYLDRQFYEEKANESRWGTLGCTLSHARLWERCLNQNVDGTAVLVFEDDVELDPAFRFNLARILSDCGPEFGNYDIIFFPGWIHDARYTSTQMATHRYLSRMINFTLTSTAGYLLPTTALKRFITTVLPLKEVDIHIAAQRYKLNIGLVPVWPHLFHAQTAPSERLGIDKALFEATDLDTQ